MVLEGDHEVRLQGTLAFLPYKVPVEGCGLAAENVGCVLGVVVFEVVEESGRHVGVVGSRSHGGVEHTASKLVQPPGNKPARENDQGEESSKQCDALA